MTKPIAGKISILAIFGCALVIAQPNTESQAPQRAREIVQSFQQSLGARLKSAISDVGPVEAISVCQTEAPAIAASLSKQYNARVERISTKPRNPSNQPTPQDRIVLEAFAEALKTDAKAPLEHRVTGKNGTQRFYKGIQIQALCLTCHGDNVAPTIQAAIKARYPKDTATGYTLGELRGAFVVEF